MYYYYLIIEILISEFMKYKLNFTYGCLKVIQIV
jgi:hypothetical protein